MSSTGPRPSHAAAPSIIGVIPARWSSTRLPQKILADIVGKPMIQHVYERARRARGLKRLVVATDDERIVRAVEAFGGEALLTSSEIRSGTDRVAAVADQIAGDVYVNIQGDEPLIEPEAIERAAELVTSGRFDIGTVMVPLASVGELEDPAVVKVLADRAGRALYFSRLPIPYSRGPRPPLGEPFACRRHVGLYTYSRAALMRFRELPASALEKGEVLEQLRALEDGLSIGVAEADFVSIGVDTPEDLEKVRTWLSRKNTSS